MIVKSDPTGRFLPVDNHCKQLLQRAISHLTPTQSPITIDYLEDLYAEDFAQGCLFLIKEGLIGYEQEGTFVFEFDAGDLIGLSHGLEGPSVRYFAELPVTLVPMRREDLFKALFTQPERSRAWSDYLLSDRQRLTTALALSAPELDRKTLGMQVFGPGDVIIEEGERADKVYTIIEGHAEVFAHGVKVGEVSENQIFGALSLLTDKPRTASVIADRRCMVMVVPHDQFEMMLRSHSHICLQLMKDMAHQIICLNEMVTVSV